VVAVEIRKDNEKRVDLKNPWKMREEVSLDSVSEVHSSGQPYRPPTK
jgi:hypothetical protein